MPDQPGPFTAPDVVVGIDGSRAGIRAALWAVDEAICRDVPLRLVTVTECAADTPSCNATETAHTALQAAATAVRETGKPVRITTEVRTGSPTLALLEASRAAAMVCVGAVGFRRIGHHKLGSTAAALAASVHCPVAVIRGSETSGPSRVVVQVDDTPESAAVLQFAVAEARLRDAGLRVLSARAHLDRRLPEWRRRYPDLDVEPVAGHPAILHYVSRSTEPNQLLVVAADNTTAVGELLGPAGQTALHNTNCSLLVLDRQRLL